MQSTMASFTPCALPICRAMMQCTCPVPPGGIPTAAGRAFRCTLPQTHADSPSQNLACHHIRTPRYRYHSHHQRTISAPSGIAVHTNRIDSRAGSRHYRKGRPSTDGGPGPINSRSFRSLLRLPPNGAAPLRISTTRPVCPAHMPDYLHSIYLPCATLPLPLPLDLRTVSPAVLIRISLLPPNDSSGSLGISSIYRDCGAGRTSTPIPSALTQHPHPQLHCW